MLTQRASLSVLTAALLLASAAPAHASCDPLVPTVTRCEDSPPEMRAEPPPPPAPEPQPADQPQPVSGHQPQSGSTPTRPQPATPPRQPAATPPTPQVSDVGAAAAMLVELVNGERRSAGLPPLQSSSAAAGIAAAHSRAMAAQGRIWHNNAYFSDATRSVLGARALGENVAMNASASDAHRRLMASPAHRSNILNAQFQAVGVGVAVGARGLLYVTESFFEPVSRGLAQPAAPAAAGQQALSPAAATAGPPAPTVSVASRGVPVPVEQRGRPAARMLGGADRPAPALVILATVLIAGTAAATARTRRLLGLRTA